MFCRAMAIGLLGSRIAYALKEPYLLVYRQPDAVVSQAYPGMPRCFLAFPHLRQSLSLLLLGEKGVWIVWCEGEVRLRIMGREILIQALA